MITTLITEEALKQHLPPNNIILINTKDITKAIEQIKTIINTPIHIYDITNNAQHNQNEIIEVSNHINKTGHNPLIGHQKRFSEPFVDISQLYNSTSGITTHCLGKYFKTHKERHQYPSKYLCYIAIITRALGKKNIEAFLVNQL